MVRSCRIFSINSNGTQLQESAINNRHQLQPIRPPGDIMSVSLAVSLGGFQQCPKPQTPTLNPKPVRPSLKAFQLDWQLEKGRQKKLSLNPKPQTNTPKLEALNLKPCSQERLLYCQGRLKEAHEAALAQADTQPL